MIPITAAEQPAVEAAENWLYCVLAARTDRQIRLTEAIRQGRRSGHRATDVVAAKRRMQRDGLIQITRDHKSKLVWRLSAPEGRRAA